MTLLFDILTELLALAIGFVIGSLFRKTTLRKITRLKRSLLNDRIYLEYQADREFPYVKMRDLVEPQIRSDLMGNLPEIEVTRSHARNLRIKMPPPLSANMIVKIEDSSDIIPKESDFHSYVRITIKTDGQVGIGIREIKHLDKFREYTSIIFQNIAANVFVQPLSPISTHTKCYIYSKEEPSADKKEYNDEDLKVKVVARQDGITLTADGLINLSEPVDKYYDGIYLSRFSKPII